ncbi:saccharopine dehydrogenase NADP-binding domain-containing protein [candidate division KSB1 bacterium]|nr:saccharopine dehydrogenase NADP-binding domain-containing protein [candidate division KSB1 bacterium]
MKKITVLGAGLIGKAIAIDLCGEYDVTAVDIRAENLKQINLYHNIEGIHADLSKPKTIEHVIADADLVIGAVPGHMGFKTLKCIINSGKNVVDISFFNEDPFKLDTLAKEKGVTAAVDCGLAPGMSNLLLGYHNKRMEIENFECYVGGLPTERVWPYEYKAPFSPIDVIEEYTRPARIVEHGQVITKPAMSHPELIDFEGIGTLEAFLTDGLRTLIRTMKIPYMKEKTLRYPGHINIMRALRESGFFSKEPIDLHGTVVRPLEVTTKLLFPLWQLKPDEHEFTVMRLIIEGKEKNKPKKYVYNLIDRYEEKHEMSSMARTTGYPCIAIARLVIEGKLKHPGICPPELIAEKDNCYTFIMDYLGKKGISYSLD